LLLASTSFAGHAAHHYKENYKGEAMPCPVELMIKDGFYVGLQGGLDSYRVKNEVAVLDPNGPFAIAMDPVLSAVGPVGGLFVGWGMYFDQYYNAYLGLEIFGNWTGAHTDFEEATASPDLRMLNTSVKAKSNYGIDVLPGVKVNNASLFYVRLGYNWARINVSQDFIDGADSAANDSVETKKTRGGFHYGVGIETTFWDNWSVRGEYTHTGFSKVSGESSSTSTSIMSSEFMPSDNQFMLGLLYHFTI
jgi:opacity protein-like surface antigen